MTTYTARLFHPLVKLIPTDRALEQPVRALPGDTTEMSFNSTRNKVLDPANWGRVVSTHLEMHLCQGIASSPKPALWGLGRSKNFLK
jgi:hypothetical protein